jgi:hypothetical protein
LQPLSVSRLALPNDFDAPSCCSQGGVDTLVALAIGGEFLAPIFLVRLGHGGFATARMPMPKTAVNEDRQLMLGKDDIGPSREVAPVQAEPIPKRMDSSTNDQFWFRVLRVDTSHDSASAREIYMIDHHSVSYVCEFLPRLIAMDECRISVNFTCLADVERSSALGQNPALSRCLYTSSTSTTPGTARIADAIWGEMR